MPAFLRLGWMPVFWLLAFTPVTRASSSDASPSTDHAPENSAGVVLNIRDFGAIGDGRLHYITEWIDRGRFRSMRALRRAHPFVDSEKWTIDEVAFTLAKKSLPAEGGTIHFPAGHYVTGRHPWRIWQDNIRLKGDGADRTTLSTAPEIEDALSVAPYRHIGWLEGAKREFPYMPESGAPGDDFVQLKEAAWTQAFRPGELVFIRNGANRYDQDYGEFNEVSGVDASGRLFLKHPLARDYRAARLNWANEIAEAFVMPPAGKAVKVVVKTGEGFFLPPSKTIVTVGDNLFRVEQAARQTLYLVHHGRGNAPPGTVIPAGTKVAKSRTVLKLTRTTRNFRCEGFTIIGRRKTLNVSNSYDVAFADCVLIRELQDGAFKGGLTIDGDGGRFARFDRCHLIARPAIGMQFARSFGSVVFRDCTFTDTNAAFTEFNFDCEVSRSRFEVNGTRALTQAIIAGKSCGDIRILENEIHARKVPFVFDTVSDIHSQKHGGEGGVIIRDNIIHIEDVKRVFPHAGSHRLVLENNQVESLPHATATSAAMMQ